MGPAERRRRIEKVLPPHGQPWAPPGRCATTWLILAEALENEHDAAGAVLGNELIEHGTVRALKLRWRGRLRGGWAAKVPVLHLDATLRGATATLAVGSRSRRPCLIGVRCSAARPRQGVTRRTAPERDEDRGAPPARPPAYSGLRARELRGTGRDTDLLLVGQKAAIDALRAAGLPPRVDAVHLTA